MADDPSAAGSGRPTRSGRGDAARRRTVWRRAAAAVGVVALLVAAGFLLFGDGVPGIDDGDHDVPGDFRFDLTDVRASGFSDTPPPQLKDVAAEAGEGVKATLDELYFRAFVDAGSWGDYAAAFELFDGPAGAEAEAQTDVLTLGSAAGEEYERLEPTLGTLSIVILADDRDRPVGAIAEVDFAADAERHDGTATRVHSSGSYFLRPAAGGWRIYAFQLTRDEQAAGGATPTEEPS